MREISEKKKKNTQGFTERLCILLNAGISRYLLKLNFAQSRSGRMQNEPFRMLKITAMVVHNKIQFEEFDYHKMADAVQCNIITT